MSFNFFNFYNSINSSKSSTFAAVKQKAVILLMFVAFILMWACSPSSLRRDKGVDVAKAVGVLPQIDEVPLDSVKKMAEHVV